MFTPSDKINDTFQSDSSIFLAGGISHCPDWQSTISGMFDKKYSLFNPRRPNMTVFKKEDSDYQIEWECKYLNFCDHIIFWFPKESVCPITLFELGKYTATDKNIVIGIEKGYTRSFDIMKQMSLLNGRNIRIVSTLKEIVSLF